jgi:hypothetical protein
MPTDNITMPYPASFELPALGLRAGEWIEVRSKSEILATLDQRGRLEELPFMPQMFHFCGRRLKVFKRAHKTCDTVNDYKGRRMHNAVHLEGIRCDGQVFGGCEAGCLLFWKEAWLKRIAGPANAVPPTQPPGQLSSAGAHCTEADVLAATRRPTTSSMTEPAYICQATQVPAATEPLSAWQLGQYVEDYRSGNVTLSRIAASFLYMGYRHWMVNLGIGVGPALRFIYDLFQKLIGGVPYPRRVGKLPIGTRTPTLQLGLQPGEWVRVRSYAHILATCDREDKNRGMKYDAEMVPYCGGTFRVLKRVNQILDEKTGIMRHMRTPCILLEGVVCQSKYSECRLFCSRSIYLYWREIWLERVPGPLPTQTARNSPVVADVA